MLKATPFRSIASTMASACSRDPDNRPGDFAWLIGKWQDGYCPVGPWVVHRSALRRLLAILDKAERTIESVTRERDDLLERVPGA